MMPDNASFWDRTAAAGLAGRFVADCKARVVLGEIGGGLDLESCRGKSVLLLSARQLPVALAAAALDGVARRLVFCPADLDPAQLPAIFAEAEIDLCLGEEVAVMHGVPAFPFQARPAGRTVARNLPTEWLLFTSGTTGRPKMVVHTLDSLAGPLADGVAGATDAVWTTFYDIRRYGGMQILLRALLGGASLVLSDAAEPVAAFLARAGAAGVTHISGTPSHWRRALMSGAAGAINPRYIRLSGEVADQAILDRLAATFPGAAISHAFASTEAGVGFDVADGRAGFPVSFIGRPGPVELDVRDGSLRLRSARTASRYAGAGAIADATGFVDTGDMVERRGERYHFVGRREGIINVGGQKVHPEEVEAVMNAHPAVRMSRVRARRSPITGALVVADLVLRDDAAFPEVREEVLALCRRALPAHKIPTALRQVPALEIGAAGKLSRVA